MDGKSVDSTNGLGYNTAKGQCGREKEKDARQIEGLGNG
jgi:hypothetical protein